MSFIRLAARASALPSFARIAPRVQRQVIQRVAYSAQAGLSRDAIQSRVFEVLKGFEKVDPAKISITSKFNEDLGLDSLDQVEVVMAVEEEFAIEIPDEEADAITTVQQGAVRPIHYLLFYAYGYFSAIDYVAKTPAAN
ncbi:hypothetical protein C0992_004659 [Termitomyces sp. T32_za158]|nr:hypothetical protein C0992_004659 [Termitomyces sp. T32_za158]